MALKNRKARQFPLQSAGLRQALVVLLASAATSACSSDDLDFKEKLTIAMLGRFSAPPTASGNAEPEFLNFSLVDVLLTAADGSVVDIYANDPTDFRIIDRSQIIHEAAMFDYAGKTFAEIQVVFSSRITGNGRHEKDLSASLGNPVAIYNQGFEVKKGAKRRLEILVNWKNILKRDEDVSPPTETLESPTLSTVVKDD